MVTQLGNKGLKANTDQYCWCYWVAIQGDNSPLIQGVNCRKPQDSVSHLTPHKPFLPGQVSSLLSRLLWWELTLPMDSRAWNEMSFKVLSNPNHPGVLWLIVPKFVRLMQCHGQP